MAKFNVTVTRTDEYEIKIDKNVWNKKELEKWSKVFHPVSDVEDIAKDFAIAFMRNDNSYFIEGYGYVKEFYKDGKSFKKVFKKNAKGNAVPLTEDEYAKGISIRPITCDFDYDTEIK